MGKTTKVKDRVKGREKVEKMLRKLQEKAPTEEGGRRIKDMLENVYAGYAESESMDEPPLGVVVLGNWNGVGSTYHRNPNHVPGGYEPTGRVTYEDDTPSRAFDALVKMGAGAEWCDEFTPCSDCGLLIQTSPDSYGWKPKYLICDGDIRCEACLSGDVEETLREHEDKPSMALTLDMDPAEHGYVRVEGGFENGLHHGQTDDPKLIAKALRGMGIKRFLFKLDGRGQFDVSFSVYVHESEMGKFDERAFADTDIQMDQSPAEATEQALRNMPVGAAPPGHVRVVKVQPDGSTKVRDVSGEDFVAGKALDDEEG